MLENIKSVYSLLIITTPGLAHAIILFTVFSTLKDGELQILQKSRSHLKILCDIRLTQTKFHTEDPQILLATVRNLFVGRPGDRGSYTSELVVWIYSFINRRISAVLSEVFRAFPQRIQANS